MGCRPFFVPLAWKYRPAMIWDVAHYRATEPTVNRARPSPSTLARTRASRLTACGRDLDFRSIVVDTRKVARHVRRRPVRYQRDPQGMERGQSRAVVGECEGASAGAAAGGRLSVVVGQDPTADLRCHRRCLAGGGRTAGAAARPSGGETSGRAADLADALRQHPNSVAGREGATTSPHDECLAFRA